MWRLPTGQDRDNGEMLGKKGTSCAMQSLDHFRCLHCKGFHPQRTSPRFANHDGSSMILWTCRSGLHIFMSAFNRFTPCSKDDASGICTRIARFTNKGNFARALAVASGE